jgi:guanylate kinase
MNKNNLFPFSFINIVAPTSAGKTTLIQTFLKRFPSLLSFSKSVTTRDITEEEIQKGLYEKVSKSQFMKMVDGGLFLEWNELKSNGHCYGTLFSEYERLKNSGKTIITDLDNNGAQHLKQKLGNEIFNLYLLVTKEELKRRMELPESRLRDNPEERLAYAIEENNFALENEKIVFDCILPYTNRLPNEAVPIIINQMRKKHQLLLKSQ